MTTAEWSMLANVETWLAHLGEMGRFDQNADQMKANIIRGIARSLDIGGSTNANLWEQFRAACHDLVGGGADDGLDKLDSVLEGFESEAASAYTAPMGTPDARPAGGSDS